MNDRLTLLPEKSPICTSAGRQEGWLFSFLFRVSDEKTSPWDGGK